MSKKWVCKDCGKEVDWSYEELASKGNPVCPKCDGDMELKKEDLIFLFLSSILCIE